MNAPIEHGDKPSSTGAPIAVGASAIQSVSRLRRVRGKGLASSLRDGRFWSFVDSILPREPCRGAVGTASRPFPIRLCS
jgi:hypothetical protein